MNKAGLSEFLIYTDYSGYIDYFLIHIVVANHQIKTLIESLVPNNPYKSLKTITR